MVLNTRRTVQIAPVVDASSAQSRADVVLIAMSAVLLLTGLQWASLTAREAESVEPDGPEVAFYADNLSEAAVTELRWCVGMRNSHLRPVSLRAAAFEPPSACTLCTHRYSGRFSS